MDGLLGCYTTRGGEPTGASGISLIDKNDGRLALRPGVPAVNPTYLALSLDGRTLYAAVQEPEGGAIAAYRTGGDSLVPVGRPQPTGGTRSAHVSVHPHGFVLSADYGDGLLTVHPTDADGAVRERTELIKLTGTGPNPNRQEAPHAHMIMPTPSGQHVLAIDLGTDSIYRYTLDGGRLRNDTVAQVHIGAGPRHLAFHPIEPYAYIANELDSTVSVLDLNDHSVTSHVSSSPGTGDVPSQPSAIRVSPDGRFCYVANRGVDTIAVLSIAADGATLQLDATVPCGGEHPRDMTLNGDCLYSANQFSNTITQFRVDPETGVPSPIGEPVPTPAPSCLVFAR
jgi:6-phosphogluconolactonase